MAVELDTICPDSLRAFECTRNDWDATKQSRSTGASHNAYSSITDRDGAVQQTQLNYRQTLNSTEGMYNRYVYTKLNKVADNAKGPDIIIVLLDVLCIMYIYTRPRQQDIRLDHPNRRLYS